MHLCISTDPSVSTALYFGSVLSYHSVLSAIVDLPARPKQAADSQTFDVYPTRMPQCTCINRPLRPHFAGAWAKGKKKPSDRLAVSSFFQSFRRDRRRLSPISQTDLSDIPTDLWSKPRELFARWHACKVIDLRTMDRLCVRGPNDRVGGQRKRRMGSENAFRFPSLLSLGLNSQPLLLAIDPGQSMRSGFHFLCTSNLLKRRHMTYRTQRTVQVQCVSSPLPFRPIEYEAYIAAAHAPYPSASKEKNSKPARLVTIENACASPHPVGKERLSPNLSEARRSWSFNCHRITRKHIGVVKSWPQHCQ